MSHLRKDMSNIWNSVHMTLTDSQYRTLERDTQWNQYGKISILLNISYWEGVFLFIIHSQWKRFEVKWEFPYPHVWTSVFTKPPLYLIQRLKRIKMDPLETLVYIDPQVQEVRDEHLKRVYVFNYPLEWSSVFSSWTSYNRSLECFWH